MGEQEQEQGQTAGARSVFVAALSPLTQHDEDLVKKKAVRGFRLLAPISSRSQLFCPSRYGNESRLSISL